jgi:hypothetical protein
MITINNSRELRQALVSDTNYLVLAAKAILVDIAFAEDEWDELFNGTPLDELIGGSAYILEESDDPASVMALGGLFNLVDPKCDPGFEPEYIRDHGEVLSFFFAIHNGGGPVFVVDKKRV